MYICFFKGLSGVSWWAWVVLGGVVALILLVILRMLCSHKSDIDNNSEQRRPKQKSQTRRSSRVKPPQQSSQQSPQPPPPTESSPASPEYSSDIVAQYIQFSDGSNQYYHPHGLPFYGQDGQNYYGQYLQQYNQYASEPRDYEQGLTLAMNSNQAGPITVFNGPGPQLPPNLDHQNASQPQSPPYDAQVPYSESSHVPYAHVRYAKNDTIYTV